ncbi:DNA-binding core protein [Sea otter poxvirus]|uniref:DNA-binding core protein n=1 Tax=Sea otter poxvirus TaxID=1416741 RepID=A0A2U9QHL1_9POXV|nr:DNA-binding core protein [Sea otter poxvirus]AWU47088.1 DNA-binding core protein [Sea otter poxvirus]
MMADCDDKLVLNSISARILKTYLSNRISEIIDELVIRRPLAKKKSQLKRNEPRIPIDLINPQFVRKFKLCNYKSGILTSLITSLVENNYFTSSGKLDINNSAELVLTDIERKILDSICVSSSLYIDTSDVRVLSNRLKTPANIIEFNGHVYNIDNEHIEELINQMVEDDTIKIDDVCSVKDSVLIISDELLDVLRFRLFRAPQVKEGCITKTRLYDYFNRATKLDDQKIYVILKDQCIADRLCIETIKIGNFHYTKYSILANIISSNVDRCMKKFEDEFYEKIAEFVKENEKINVSRVIESLTIQSVTIS